MVLQENNSMQYLQENREGKLLNSYYEANITVKPKSKT